MPADRSVVRISSYSNCIRSIESFSLLGQYWHHWNIVVFIRLEASLQPNIGFTFECALTAFTRSDITPPKVNGCG